MIRIFNALVAVALMLGAVSIAVSIDVSTQSPTTLGVPGRANANASIAASGAVVVVAWSASAPSGATDIYLATSRDSGRTFGARVRVNDVDGDARVNGEQPPRVSLVDRASGDPAIAVVWTTKGAKGTVLRQSRSDDGGRAFARASLVPGTDAAGNRGWEAITQGRGGAVYAVWLDHRELADEAMASHHDHNGATATGKPDGVAMAQRSKLYFSSLDGSIAPRALTGGVCYCCKTAVVTGADGAIYAAWRHVYPGNMRDMAFTMSRDGGRTFAAPIRVSEDQWMLEGCPDDGPAMAVDASSRVHIVWPTLVAGDSAGADPTIALFYATSSDGRTFSARQRVPTDGVPHHPQIAVAADGSIALAWDESNAGTRRVARARMVPGRTEVQFTRTIVGNAEPSVYPAIAATRDGVVVVWTSGAPANSVIRVEHTGR